MQSQFNTIAHGRVERAIAVAKQHDKAARSAAIKGNRQIEVPIAIEIGCRQAPPGNATYCPVRRGYQHAWVRGAALPRVSRSDLLPDAP